MKAVDTVGGGLPWMFVIPILGLAVDIMLQYILCRVPNFGGHVRNQFISFGAGLASTAAALLFFLLRAGVDRLDLVGYLALHLLSYSFLGFWFFNLINLNVSSLRIRIIREIYRRHPQPVPGAILLAKYGVSDVLDARLLRLENGRQLYRISDRYYLRRGAVVHIAHLFSGLRAFLFSGTS